jgi:hypothetical protein
MAVIIKGRGGRQPDTGWAELKDLYDLGMELRRPFEQQWIINLGFLAGKQYTFYNLTAQTLQQVAARKGRLRIIDNKILPRYRKQVSRLIRNRPIMTCVPSSNDDEDIESARVGTKVLKSFWKVDQMQKKMRVLAGWIYSCGNAFLDDRWNPKKGPVKVDPVSMKVVYQGDATCGVWSPFEIVVPAYGLNDGDIHSLPWMIKAKIRPLEYYPKYYGKKGKEVRSEDVNVVNLMGLTNTFSNRGQGKIESAIEMQLYIQPNEKYPKGLYRCGANGVILEEKDYPFDFYHMEQFKDIEIPGIFWGMATAEPAIWLQKMWNSTVSDIAEFHRTMGRGKWLIPRGSNLQQAPNDSFGQMLEYTPQLGIKPEHVTIKALPTSYQQMLQYLSSAFMELYYQHEVTSGTNRSDIRSAEMVQVLLEQDDYGNIPTHAVFEEGLEASMGRVLKRIQKGYSDERMLQISGSGEEYEVISFKGADLRNNTDVNVKKESSLPDSRTARQGQVMERYQGGLYGNPADPNTQRTVQKMLDDAVVENIYSDTYRDEQIAKKENESMFAQPQKQIRINDYDNHAAHMQVHSLARKNSEHQKRKLSGNRQEIEQFLLVEMAFVVHCAQHQQMLEVARKRMMQEAMMAKGGIR